MGKFILAVLALNLSSLSLADDHVIQLGALKGEDLGLYYSDHAFSGHVNETLIFATIPKEGNAYLKLQYRMRGQNFESLLVREKGVVRATLPSVDGKEKAVETEFVVKEVNPEESTFTGTIGNKPFVAKVSADKMHGHHFVDPRFEVTLESKTYSFHLEAGEACMGCSLKILFVVLGMLEVTGAL